MNAAHIEFFNNKPKALQIGLVVEEFNVVKPIIHPHLNAAGTDPHPLSLGPLTLTLPT
jgi:hypothetical protein